MRTFGQLSDEDFIFMMDKSKPPNQCGYMSLSYGKIKEILREVPQSFKNLNVAKIEHPQFSFEMHCNMNTLLRSLLKTFQTETVSVKFTMDVLRTLFKLHALR